MSLNIQYHGILLIRVLKEHRHSRRTSRTMAARFVTLVLSVLVARMGWATEYVVPAVDVAGFFASLPKDATYLSFSAAAEYTSATDIVLPERQLLVIDGKGCRLKLGPGSNGFTCAIADQKEAMRRTASRYVIRDFASITGGRKAIDLKATLGSVVSNCRLVGQTETAIDLRFCLMAQVENVLVTNPAQRGIVLRCGDWPGANTSNSQSNHTVLHQCRVYCAATTTAAFTVLNSGGVHLTDCISEGAQSDYDLFLSATTNGQEDHQANNPVVKAFALSNFHVEHFTRKGSLYINMPPKSSVDITNVYWNRKAGSPLIVYVCGQLNLSNIGWWASEFRIHTRAGTPKINVDACHSLLVIPEKTEGTVAGSLELVDPLPGHSVLKLDFVRTTRRSF